MSSDDTGRARHFADPSNLAAAIEEWRRAAIEEWRRAGIEEERPAPTTAGPDGPETGSMTTAAE